MKVCRTLIAAALIACAPVSMASVIASDDFTYGAGELGGQNGGSGWGGAWSAVPSVTHVVDPGVDLSGNRALQFTGNDSNAAYRSLASAFVGEVLFVSFLVQVDAGSLTANDFLGLWLDTVTGGDHTGRPNIGIKSDISGGNDVFARTTGTAGAFVPGSDIGSTTDVTHRIVGRLSRSAPGNYSLFDVWLDPVLSDLASPEATFSGGSGISQVSQVGFRTANFHSGDILLFDDLRLTTTWTEALPEPTSLALIGVGLLGLGYRARRSRR